MKSTLRSVLAAAGCGRRSSSASPARRQRRRHPSAITARPGPVAGSWSGAESHAVFVQTDNPAGNQIVAYDRAPNGSLIPAGSYRTGGLGGILSGSVVDHLASEGSLIYDQGKRVVVRGERREQHRLRLLRRRRPTSGCARW